MNTMQDCFVWPSITQEKKYRRKEIGPNRNTK